MKIAFLEIKDWERAYLEKRLPGVECFFTEKKLEPELLPELRECEVLSPFIYSQVSAQALQGLPSLRLVATRSTGYDHVDLEACAARSVAVANALPAIKDIAPSAARRQHPRHPRPLAEPDPARRRRLGRLAHALHRRRWRAALGRHQGHWVEYRLRPRRAMAGSCRR